MLAVVGMLALGQTLDSLTELAGLAQHGNMAMIRSALAQVAGPDLFLAVLIVGVMAGSAEEIFFRGYMQTRLAQRLPRGVGRARHQRSASESSIWTGSTDCWRWFSACTSAGSRS